MPMVVLFVFAAMLIAASCAPAQQLPPVKDAAAASVLGKDVPIPSGAVLVNRASARYTVQSHSIEDVVAFYVQRLPEFGWILDKHASTLTEHPELGKGLRVVTGCRTDGSFVTASFEPDGSDVRLYLIKSNDTQTLNATAALAGRWQANSVQPCPS